MEPVNFSHSSNGLKTVSHLALWAIKIGLRLQKIKKPGCYGLVFIINDDGSRELVVEAGKREFLGS